MDHATWQEKLRAFLEHRVTDVVVLLLILASVAGIVAEAMAPPGCAWLAPVMWVGDGITILFAVELLLRYLAEDSWRRFLWRYWIDILAVLPLLRVFRVLRVLRLLRVFRAGLLLNRRISLFSGSFQRSLGEAVLIVVLLVVIVLAGAIGIHALEGGEQFGTFDRSFWWSFLSFMAGEPVMGMPKTAGGKVLTVIVMTGGMTIFAMLTGVFSASLVQRMREQMNERQTEIERLRRHVVVCGWNRAGDRVLQEFQYDPRFRNRAVVIVCEMDEPPRLSPEIKNRSHIFFVSGDYTRLDVLERVGLDRAGAFILLADRSKPRSDQDRDARTVLAAMLIEKKNPKAYTCVELLNRDNGAHLQEMGVEEIVVLDDYGASIIAAAAQNQGMVSIFDELFTNAYGNRFRKIEAGTDHVGKTVGELLTMLKQRHNALLLALEWDASEDGDARPGHLVNPPLDRVVQTGERLVLITTELI